MTKSQRDFLDAVSDDNLPIIFTDGAITLSVYAPRIRFSTPYKRENVGEETAELTLAEASGGAWADSAQATFLRECGDDVKPLIYTHTDNKPRPVILTRISWATPYKGPSGDEPVLQLTLVDAFAGPWLVFPPERMSIAETLTSVSIYDPTVPQVYGVARYGYSEYQ